MKRPRLKQIALLCALLTGVVYTSQAQSLTFNGTDTYVEIPANEAYNVDAAFTVELWVKLTAGGNLFSTQAWGDAGGSGIDFIIDGQHFKITLGNGDWFNLVADTVDVPIGVWTHLACTYDDVSLKLYINGVEKASGDLDNYAYTDEGAIRVGDNPTWNPRIMTGQIDEVRYWSVSRSATELTDNMSSALVGDESGLIGYWNFNEGEGTVATDNSAVANNGTIINCTWGEDFSATDVVDVAVLSASSPVSGSELTASEILTVNVQNNSSEAQTDIPIAFVLGDAEAVTESITSIDAGASVDYSFTQTLDLSAIGEYTIKVYTTLEGDEVVGNDTLTLTITNSEPEAIENINNENNNIKVYPTHVADGYVNVEFAEFNPNATITVHDISGRLAYSKELFNIEKGNIIRFNLNDLNRGLFLITVHTNNGTYSGKLVMAKQ